MNRIIFAWHQTSPIEEQMHENDVIHCVSQAINHSTRGNIHYLYKLKGVKYNLENLGDFIFTGIEKLLPKKSPHSSIKGGQWMVHGLQMQPNVECLAIRHSINIQLRLWITQFPLPTHVLIWIVFFPSTKNCRHVQQFELIKMIIFPHHKDTLFFITAFAL